MTGMGKDGANGLHELKRRGGYVVAQDKDTSVIFGMNREVIRNGDADEVAGVLDISGAAGAARGGPAGERNVSGEVRLWV